MPELVALVRPPASTGGPGGPRPPPPNRAGAASGPGVWGARWAAPEGEEAPARHRALEALERRAVVL